MTGPCLHWKQTLEAPPAPKDVCERCVELGTQWVHLRQCLVCGKTLCCDDSPMRHTTAHCTAENHPLMRSAEPGEDWAWCYPDELAFVPGPDGWEIA
jgi:CPA1 family monovalent cation:H+ antiporter